MSIFMSQLDGGRFALASTAPELLMTPNVLAARPDAAGERSEPAPGWAASRLRYSKVFADLPRQVVIDFGMAGDGAALIQ
jgi:hypothetical protein